MNKFVLAEQYSYKGKEKVRYSGEVAGVYHFQKLDGTYFYLMPTEADLEIKVTTSEPNDKA